MIDGNRRAARPGPPIGGNRPMATAILIALALLGIAEIFNHNMRSA
jgi:hypothetical protein